MYRLVLVAVVLVISTIACGTEQIDDGEYLGAPLWEEAETISELADIREDCYEVWPHSLCNDMHHHFFDIMVEGLGEDELRDQFR